MTEIVVVTTTVGSRDEAQRLAHLVVEERLAACAQVAAIESVFHWEGIRSEPEVRIDFKTAARGAEALRRRVTDLHPYDVPEVLSFTAAASPAYAAWVEEVVA